MEETTPQPTTERKSRKKLILIVLLLLLLIVISCGGAYAVNLFNIRGGQTTTQTEPEPTAPPAPPARPRWIAYYDRGSVRIMDTNGENNKEILVNGESFRYTPMAWKSSNILTYVAYDTLGQASELYNYNVETGESTPLTSFNTQSWISGAWHPSGRFYFHRGVQGTQSEGQEAGYFENDTAKVLQHWGAGQARDGSFHDEKIWPMSPDGKYIASKSTATMNVAGDYGSGNSPLVVFDSQDQVVYEPPSVYDMWPIPIGFIDNETLLIHSFVKESTTPTFILSKVNMITKEVTPVTAVADSFRHRLYGGKLLASWQNINTDQLSATEVTQLVIETIDSGLPPLEIKNLADPEWLDENTIIATTTEPHLGFFNFQTIGIVKVTLGADSTYTISPLVTLSEESKGFVSFLIEPAE